MSEFSQISRCFSTGFEKKWMVCHYRNWLIPELTGRTVDFVMAEQSHK